MYFAYVDESGDKGLPKQTGSFGEHYTLSAMLVEDKDWLNYLNRLIGFRRALRDDYGIKMSAELKSYHFIRGNGPFTGLGFSNKKRMSIFKRALKQLSKMESLVVWAVVINKSEWENRWPYLDIFGIAWQNMGERFERFTFENGKYLSVFPDDGSNVKVRTILRQLRRFSRPQSAYAKMTLERNAELVLEDPNFRLSQDSYFTQFADYCAYAATRAIFPKSWCDERYWNYLGEIRSSQVNRVNAKAKKVVRGIAAKP